MDTDWNQLAESIIGYEFKDKTLLELALSHSSAVDSRDQSNERLEFLGDAVLGFIVCNETFQRFPDFEEGDMTKVKSSVVSRKVCAEIAQELDLNRILMVGKGMNGGSLPESVSGAAYEAIIGAIYLDTVLRMLKNLSYVQSQGESTRQRHPHTKTITNQSSSKWDKKSLATRPPM